MMNRMKQIKITNLLIVFMAVAVITSACTGGAATEPTQDPDVVFTQVAETVMVSMTQTAEAAPPTATPQPSPTQLPPLPPTATVDPNAPTETAIPTQPIGSQPTQQCYGDCAKWNTQSPADGTTLGKHEAFTFHVCIGNIGSTEWTTAYYLEWAGGYLLSGMTVINIGNPVDDTVPPGNTWCFDIPCTSPYNAGEYISRWYLKNSEGQTFLEVYFHYFVG